MQELPIQILQECALGTLVNIFGGMHATVINVGLESIKPSRSDIHVADIVGALAYALKMFNENSNDADSLDAVNIEGLLFRQLKPCISKLVQSVQLKLWMASMAILLSLRVCDMIKQKDCWVGLVTMVTSEVQEELMHF